MKSEIEIRYATMHKKAWCFYTQKNFFRSLDIVEEFIFDSQEDWYAVQAHSFKGLIYSAMNDTQNKLSSYEKAYQISLNIEDIYEIYLQGANVMFSLIELKRLEDCIALGEWIQIKYKTEVIAPLKVFLTSLGKAYLLSNESTKLDLVVEQLRFTLRKNKSKSLCLRMIENCC